MIWFASVITLFGGEAWVDAVKRVERLLVGRTHQVGLMYVFSRCGRVLGDGNKEPSNIERQSKRRPTVRAPTASHHLIVASSSQAGRPGRPLGIRG